MTLSIKSYLPRIPPHKTGTETDKTETETTTGKTEAETDKTETGMDKPEPARDQLNPQARVHDWGMGQSCC